MVKCKQFEVYLVDLNPTLGSEINKTRPCIIISPDEINDFIKTVIIAPMTTKGRDYPTRVALIFAGKQGQIVLDQIRTVDKLRLVKKIGKIKEPEAKKVSQILQEMFAYSLAH